MKHSKRIFIILGEIFWSPFRCLSKKSEQVKSLLYTGSILKEFKSFGDNSVISYKAIKLEGLEWISIGSNTVIRKNVQLTAWNINNATPSISIGNNCCIREGAHITAINKIEIGNNLLTGTNILISDNSHGSTQRESLDIPPYKRELTSKGIIVIEDNVWIGNNACILGNVRIGKGSIIGANAVVTHDVPPYSIAVGIPAQSKKITKQKVLI